MPTKDCWALLNAMLLWLQAQLIESNADAVDQAINAVRVALAQGLSWAELERLIKDEAAAGNQVAGLVHALHLDRNAVTLVLPDWIAAADREADLDSGDVDDADSDDENGNVPTALVSPCPQMLPQAYLPCVQGLIGFMSVPASCPTEVTLLSHRGGTLLNFNSLHIFGACELFPSGLQIGPVFMHDG